MDFLKLIHAAHVNRLMDSGVDLLTKYFRLTVNGLENVPRSGKVLVASNHSGYAGFDALILLNILQKHHKKMPQALAHRFFFEYFAVLRLLAAELNLNPANFSGACQILKDGYPLLIFPEAEKGNFKSSFARYKLQQFHTGFVRMAISCRAPLIPAIVLGAEESHFNLGAISLGKMLGDLKVPLPVNLMPLPAKWTISFLKPVDLTGYPLNSINDREKMRKLSAAIRFGMQREILRELKSRKGIFLA